MSQATTEATATVTQEFLNKMLEEMAKLKNENSNLKARGTGIKVSEKGAVSVYGLGRFPVTLYKEQWIKLFAKREEIEGFITANDSQLKAKAQ